MAKIRCVDIYAGTNDSNPIPVETFEAMKKSGITSVIIRCSWTHQGSFRLEKDKLFIKNIKNAIKAGMKIGVYHYSQAITETEAIDEANFVLNTIKRYKKHITLPVAFDTEFGGWYENGKWVPGRWNATVAKRNGKVKNLKICKAFCKTIQAHGYDVMVYANYNMLTNYISAKLPEKFKVWVAQYNKTCDYKKPYYMWQYTSTARYKSVKGDLDMSVFAPKK